MKCFEGLLDLLPEGQVFDGELVVLDDAGRPVFNELLSGRRYPTYVALDLLIADGIDLRPLPLKQRKAALPWIGKHAERWIALTPPHQLWAFRGGDSKANTRDRSDRLPRADRLLCASGTVG